MKAVFLFLFYLSSIFLTAQKIHSPLSYSVIHQSHKHQKAPVLIILHGYGANENDFLETAKQFNIDFLIGSLRAPYQVGTDGFCWYEIERVPNEEPKYDYKQTVESREKIIVFIREFCKKYHGDTNNVYLLGFSQGAVMSYDLLLHSKLKIKGVIPLSGKILKETKVLSDSIKVSKKANIFIGHGTHDDVINYHESDRAIKFLIENKFESVNYKYYPTIHTVTSQELLDIKLWLNTVMNSEKKYTF